MGIAAIAIVLFAGVPGAGAATKTASQLLASSRASAKGEPSFHYLATSTTPGRTVTITGDVSASEGHQSIVDAIGGTVGHVSVSLVRGSAYFEGDLAGLTKYMELPPTLAGKYVGQWISLTQSDKEYSSVAAALTIASTLDEMEISKPLSLHGTSHKLGNRVVAIGGTVSVTPPGSAKKATLPVRLYVSATGKPLPVLYSASGTVAKKKLSQLISFSGWGTPVSVTAPSTSVPAATLGASPVEA